MGKIWRYLKRNKRFKYKPKYFDNLIAIYLKAAIFP